MNWRKSEIKILRQKLNNAWLSERNPSGPQPAQLVEAFRRALAPAATRHAVILAGLRGFRNMLLDRAAENASAAEHFRLHPTIYAESTPEMVARFRGLADDCMADVELSEELIAKVESTRPDELPPEILSHDPTA